MIFKDKSQKEKDKNVKIRRHKAERFSSDIKRKLSGNSNKTKNNFKI